MRLSFFRSLLLSLSPGGSLTGRGTGKDLKICCCSRSPSKTNAPLIISPQCFLHGGLWDQWFWESAGIWQITASNRRKKIGMPLFLSLPPTPPPSFAHRARSTFAGSIWVHLSKAGGPLCPLGLQGLRVLQCGSLLLWKRGAWAWPLACLGHLKALIHPIPCFTRPPAHPRCPEAWLV